MFTGLIREKGKVVRRDASAAGARITVEARGLGPAAAPGDSISVDGACLTVAAREGARLSFDVSGETLSLTTLGSLKAGDAVNLEDSLTPVSKVGGHFVLGHVDGVGTVVSARPIGETMVMTFRAPHELSRYLVPKGSVAVDGISLTVNEVHGDTFAVTLIPHTLDMVTLGEKRAGHRVNLETDILVRAVERLLGEGGASRAASR